MMFKTEEDANACAKAGGVEGSGPRPTQIVHLGDARVQSVAHADEIYGVRSVLAMTCHIRRSPPVNN